MKIRVIQMPEAQETHKVFKDRPVDRIENICDVIIRHTDSLFCFSRSIVTTIVI